MANLLLAVPYGLGAGGVDAALNTDVAIHYASRHMNWLHCMRGIGASAAGQCAMVVASGDVVQANPEFAPSRWVYGRRGHTGRGVRRGGDGAAVESADVGGPA